MEQFNLEKWLQDKSRKVVTRDGREVEIFYYNADKTLLVGRISPTEIHQYTEDGFQYDIINEAKNDLFFAEDEEELTEFEKALLAAFNCVAGKAVTTFGPASFQDDVDEWGKPLLDLARKELEKEDWRKPLRVYKNGYKQGKQDALKHLPKWKKATEHKKFVLHVCVIDEDMCPFLDTEVEEGEYYIELDDLKTLPKEE